MATMGLSASAGTGLDYDVEFCGRGCTESGEWWPDDQV